MGGGIEKRDWGLDDSRPDSCYIPHEALMHHAYPSITAQRGLQCIQEGNPTIMDDLLTGTACRTPAQPSQKRQYKRGETTSYNVCVERQHNYPCICGANWFAKQKDKYYCCAKHNQIQMYPLMPTSTVRMNTALNLFSHWEWKLWFRRNPIVGKRLHHTVSRPMPWALPLNTISSVNGGQRKQIHQEYQFFFQTQIYNTPHVHPWRCHHGHGSKYCIIPPR